MSKCVVKGCQEEAHYVSSGLCKNCYAAMYYWRNKTPTQVMNRRKQLKKLEGRFDSMVLGSRRRAG